MKERNAPLSLPDTSAPLVRSVHISGSSAGSDNVPQGLKCDHVMTDFPFVL